MPTRYIDISSEFRDRKSYPNVCDFVVKVNAFYNNTPFTAEDPVILSFPYEANLTSGGSTPSQIALAVTSSVIRNYYRNSYLQIGNEIRRITAYNDTTQVATVSPAFSVAPAALTEYTIRKEQPILRDTILVNSPSVKQVQLGAAASSTDNAYVNMYILLPGPGPLNPALWQYTRIVAYNGTTKIATLATSLRSIVLAGEIYEILAYSYNNSKPLQYAGTDIFSNPNCKNVRIVNLLIPSGYVANGYGGNLSNYSHVYVNLFSEKSRTYQNTIISNNPAAQHALFKVPITYYNNNTFYSLISSDMSQNISFRENDDLHFQIILPNGEILRFEEDQSGSNLEQYGFPIEPNPFTQVKLTVEITQ